MARYLIDVNLPRWFSLWAGSDYEFMHDIGPDWSDSRIWEYAARNALTIVTKDADFSDRVLVNVDGPRVIHVRVGNLTIGDLHRYLASIWPDICRQAIAADSCRCTEIASKPSNEPEDCLSSAHPGCLLASLSCPANAGHPVFTSPCELSRCRGVLDHPLARMMTGDLFAFAGTNGAE